MTRRLLVASIAVLVAWMGLDYLIHVVLLAEAYEMTSSLWRSKEEIRYGVMIVAFYISALFFTLTYARFCRDKCAGSGTLYGLLIGLLIGSFTGYGMYAVMPITYEIALVWFLGTLIEMTVGGLLAGLILSRRDVVVSAAG